MVMIFSCLLCDFPQEHELLSVINTLCSTWMKNKKKDKLIVLDTFKIMLHVSIQLILQILSFYFEHQIE